jgi:hypothetical protein
MSTRLHELLALLVAGALSGSAACSMADTQDKDLTTAATAMVLEFNGKLTGKDRYDIEQRGIEVAEYLGDNKYVALVPKGEDLSDLRQQTENLRSVLPLGMEYKIDDSLRADEFPDYARRGERLMIQVSFFRSAEDNAAEILRAYSVEIDHDDESNYWVADILPSELEQLAQYGQIRRIELVADPKLLEEDPMAMPEFDK